MTEITKIVAGPVSEFYGSSSETTLRKALRRCTAGILLSVCLGAVADAGGLAILALSAMGAIEPSTGVNTLGGLLTAVWFLLFVFAAHCYDKIDSADKARRFERSTAIITDQEYRV